MRRGPRLFEEIVEANSALPRDSDAALVLLAARQSHALCDPTATEVTVAKFS